MPPRLIDSWNISTKTLTQLVGEETSNANPQSLHFLSAHAVVEASKSTKLNEVLKSGKNICDSRPLNFYLNRFVRSTPQVRGSDFMKSMLLNSDQDARHYFLGGNLETLKGIENYVKIRRNPAPAMCFYSPSYSIPWQEAISEWIDRILVFRADFVWVGMGAPKQFHISNEITKGTKVPAYSVGAAFDFIAGTKKESPIIISKLGLEWFFRLVTEPRRLWKRYLLGNLLFIKIITTDLWSRLKDEN